MFGESIEPKLPVAKRPKQDSIFDDFTMRFFAPEAIFAR
jgi:hypothetical protein